MLYWVRAIQNYIRLYLSNCEVTFTALTLDRYSLLYRVRAMETTQCPVCGQHKPLNDFLRLEHNKQTYITLKHCIDCKWTFKPSPPIQPPSDIIIHHSIHTTEFICQTTKHIKELPTKDVIDHPSYKLTQKVYENLNVYIPNNCRGIYFLFHQSQIVYIGQAQNIISRIGYHTKRFTFDSTSFIYVPTYYNLNDIERFLIGIYNPKNNISILLPKSFTHIPQILQLSNSDIELLKEQFFNIEYHDSREIGSISKIIALNNTSNRSSYRSYKPYKY